MTGNRLQIVLVSAFVSFGYRRCWELFRVRRFWTQNNNMAQHELPQHAEGATHVISTSAYLGQPAPTLVNQRLPWSTSAYLGQPAPTSVKQTISRTCWQGPMWWFEGVISQAIYLKMVHRRRYCPGRPQIR